MTAQQTGHLLQLARERGAVDMTPEERQRNADLMDKALHNEIVMCNEYIMNLDEKILPLLERQNNGVNWLHANIENPNYQRGVAMLQEVIAELHPLEEARMKADERVSRLQTISEQFQFRFSEAGFCTDDDGNWVKILAVPVEADDEGYMLPGEARYYLAQQEGLLP